MALLLAGLHSALNVRSASPAAAAAAVTPLSLASNQPIKQARDARLPPLQAGDSVEVNIGSSDDTVEIASGVQYQAWTFGKTVPGPVIHVRQGQTVNVTFTNRGTMQHSIDFHSAITPPSLHYVEIMPGESIKFSFVAKVPGAFLYHCSTPPVGPGEGAVFDLTLDEAGKYPFVDHSMAHAVLGAQGILEVSTPGQELAKPRISKASVDANAAPPPAATGLYTADPAHGAQLYATYCAACHQATGMGLPGAFPPLKGNAAVLNADPAKHLDVILHGLHGEAIDGISYPSAMPPFAASLNDADIADIANHERISWGNQGEAVTAEHVKAARTAAK